MTQSPSSQACSLHGEATAHSLRAGNLALPQADSRQGHSYSDDVASSMRFARRRSRLLQIIFRLRCWWLLQEIAWRLAWRSVVSDRWRR